MKRVLQSAVILFCVVGVVSACEFSGPMGDRSRGGAECSETFSLRRWDEPLGPYSSYWDETRKAAQAAQPTTLGELIRTSGWSEGWDRMVEVPPEITAEQLDVRAGTQGVCWEDLPEYQSSDGPAKGYYLFLQGNTPLQVVSWDQLFDRYFKLPDSGVAYPHSLLTPIQYEGNPAFRVEPS